MPRSLISTGDTTRFSLSNLISVKPCCWACVWTNLKSASLSWIVTWNWVKPRVVRMDSFMTVIEKNIPTITAEKAAHIFWALSVSTERHATIAIPTNRETLPSGAPIDILPVIAPITTNTQCMSISAANSIQIAIIGFNDFSTIFIHLAIPSAMNIKIKKVVPAPKPNNKIPAVSERDMPIGTHLRVKMPY